MDNMEYIDDYFNHPNTVEEKQQFEQRIIHDVSFAEEVAFYISTHHAIKEQLQIEQKERFRELCEKNVEICGGCMYGCGSRSVAADIQFRYFSKTTGRGVYTTKLENIRYNYE